MPSHCPIQRPFPLLILPDHSGASDPSLTQLVNSVRVPCVPDTAVYWPSSHPSGQSFSASFKGSPYKPSLKWCYTSFHSQPMSLLTCDFSNLSISICVDSSTQINFIILNLPKYSFLKVFCSRPSKPLSHFTLKNLSTFFKRHTFHLSLTVVHPPECEKHQGSLYKPIGLPVFLWHIYFCKDEAWCYMLHHRNVMLWPMLGCSEFRYIVE